MRGRDLFNDLIQPDQPDVTVKENKRKGRSSDLITKRDAKLIARYYYHAIFLRKRYDDVLSSLEEEFDISIGTIPQVIEKNATGIQQIKNEKPGKKDLMAKWPFFVW
jgi:hypothetical protein